LRYIPWISPRAASLFEDGGGPSAFPDIKI
jgi:hypothetical protein